jgi:hypothetical protein
MASGGVWRAGNPAAHGLVTSDQNRCSLGLPSWPYLATMLPSSFLLSLELGKAPNVETA